MSFSLKQIRHFLAAAESGQISRAAVEHNISQSALTASIQQLEAMLGSPLFERRPSGVALTHAGTRFLPLARKVAAACNEAMAISHDMPRKVRGSLVLAATDTISGYFLTPLLTRFRRVFPEVALTMREARRLDVEAGLLSGELEVAVVLTSNITPRDDLARRTLFQSTRRLWTASEHPLLREERIGLAEVATYPYIALTTDEAFDTASRYWEASSYRPNVIFETNSVEAVRSMVGAGLGITILSDMVFRPWSLEAQRIETRDLADPVPSMDVGLAWSNDRALSATARSFVDFAVSAFLDRPPANRRFVLSDPG